VTAGRCALTAVLLALAWSPSRVEAFSVASGASVGCHETITTAAFRRMLREPRENEPPASYLDDFWLGVLPNEPPTGPVMRLAEAEFPFEASSPWQTKLAYYSLIAGSRFNDLEGIGLFTLDSLRTLHGAIFGQEQHCLRAVTDDGDEGDAKALQACRAYIETELLIFGTSFSYPTTHRTEAVEVFVELYGSLELELVTGLFHLGRALHDLEDSYAHTLRTDDLSEIVAVTNFIECVGIGLEHEEARDGPCHSSALDQCEEADIRPLKEAAIEAAIELTEALRLEPEPMSVTLAARWQPVLEGRLAYRAGCTLENQYCDTSWRAISQKGTTMNTLEIIFGCGVVNAGAGRPVGALLLLLLLLLPVVRRLVRRWRMLMVALVLLLPAAAGAEKWVALDFAPSIDDPALSYGGQFGIRRGRWGLLARLEHSAWIQYQTRRGLLAGALDVGVGGELMHFGGHAASTLLLGTSTLLFDTTLDSQGSTGIYAEIRPAGLRFGRGRVRLRFDPLTVAIVAPVVGEHSMAMVQYRCLFGLELGL
jgi:hypothetical protein